MTTWLSLTGIIIWTSAFYAIGIFFFTQGFLLRRLTVKKNSTCVSEFHHRSVGTQSTGCWLDRSYKRAVLIIIDALRYDFVRENNSVGVEHPFLNKFKYVNQLLHQKPMNSRLFKFMADPPTTTMQRLKGLTTGGLPTFIDIGENFDSSEISEDNIIDQLLHENKKVTFIGDDTWLGLYPKRFHRSFPFPSFNVMDLHTVDNGVIQHLLPEFLRADWDVLVAHFLGVDHCGHKFGPNHPAMTDKLSQMDAVIRNLTQYMKDDTILFVFGDHGMTPTGDHGGDSDDELESSLFIYSTSPITSNPKPQDPVIVSQSDLVPTLALLLGVPIPHSNLGCVITDLFSHSPQGKSATNAVQNVYYSVEALHVNAHQVLNYLDDYSKLSQDIPVKEILTLKNRFSAIESRLQALVTSLYYQGDDQETLTKFRTIRDDLRQLLVNAKETCARVWSRFNLFSMTLGLCVVGLTMWSTLIVIYKPGASKKVIITVSCIVSFIIALYLLEDSDLAKILGASGTCVIMVILLIFAAFMRKTKTEFADNFTKYDGFVMFCFGGGLLCFFSNSFVVHEDSVLTFLVATVACTMMKWNYSSTVVSPRCGKAKDKSLFKRLMSPLCIMTILVLSLCALVRLTAVFHACREEQHCQSSTALRPLLSFVPEENAQRNFRYILSVVVTLILPVVYSSASTRAGNLNGYSPSTVCHRYSPTLIALFTIGYWTQNAVPNELLASVPSWQKRFLPMSAYFTIITSFLTTCLDPMTVFTVYRDVRGLSTDGNVIARVYQYMRQSYSGKRPPLVYGLATVYSSHLMFVALLVVQLLMLLHSDGLAPVFVVMVAGAVLTLEVTSYNRRRDQISPPSLSGIILWLILAGKFFFASGHQATFPTLQWQAAFVGFDGDHSNNVVPAVLMLLNTFGSHIAFTMALSLLIVWPLSRASLSRSPTVEHDRPVDDRGEYILHEDHDELVRVSKYVFLAYQCLSAMRLLFTMISAMALRRHLMVWKIFAPRFVMEAAAFCVVTISLMISTIILARLDAAVGSWTKQICKEEKTS